MDDKDKLRLDYEQTNEYFRMLTDIRFKLLAFVPTATGAAVSLFSQAGTPEVTLAVGLLGFLATLGIMIYEIRNTQFYDAAVHRAKWLEFELGLPVMTKYKQTGGLFNERPTRPHLLGIPLWHDLGLALVYGSALGIWIYLIVDSTTRLVKQPNFAVSIGSAAIIAILLTIIFLRISSSNKPAPTDEMRDRQKSTNSYTFNKSE